MYSWLASRSLNDCGDQTICIYSPKRRLATSWGTPSDLSSSASPASILPRKTRRSIIIESGVGRHGLEGFDHAIAGKWLRHGGILMHLRSAVTTASRSFLDLTLLCTQMPAAVSIKALS